MVLEILHHSMNGAQAITCVSNFQLLSSFLVSWASAIVENICLISNFEHKRMQILIYNMKNTGYWKHL